MAFTIFSQIPNRIVSVQIDNDGTFDVVGDAEHARQVNLQFVQVHVNGNGIIQAQRVLGVEDGDIFSVELNGNLVIINLEA